MHDIALVDWDDRLDWFLDASNSFSVSSERVFLVRSLLGIKGMKIRWNNWVPITF